MTTTHDVDGTLIAYAKGAPEVILESCDRVLTAEGDAPLDAAGRHQILSQAQTMAGEALRVLGVAAKPDVTLETAEHGMIFLGLAGMIDPPRPEAKVAIAVCAEAGIRPVMITGDHPVTAQAVARELGLLQNGGRVVTGAELEEMPDEQLRREVEEISVYARVSPATLSRRSLSRSLSHPRVVEKRFWMQGKSCVDRSMTVVVRRMSPAHSPSSVTHA